MSQRYTRTPTQIWEAIKTLAREKRHAPTPAENHLWQRLRRHQIAGLQFRRQHSIDRFIVDFYCPAVKLVVEVDGDIHQYTQVEDAMRQEFLESTGLRVLRFSNEQVLSDTERVIRAIEQAVKNRHSFEPEEKD
jgi:very-short-patch-repair endonuclease